MPAAIQFARCAVADRRVLQHGVIQAHSLRTSGLVIQHDDVAKNSVSMPVGASFFFFFFRATSQEQCGRIRLAGAHALARIPLGLLHLLECRWPGPTRTGFCAWAPLRYPAGCFSAVDPTYAVRREWWVDVDAKDSADEQLALPCCQGTGARQRFCKAPAAREQCDW